MSVIVGATGDERVAARGDSLVLLGADVGGTFTDIVLIGSDGQLHRRKVPSTPPDFGRAVTDSLPELLAEAGVAAAELDLVLHATTAATNAILELRGARTALVTTAGFRDVLEIARGRRPSLFDLGWRKPQPLVPRALRFEISERMSAHGEVVMALNDDEIQAIVRAVDDADVDAVAICLINSYVNPIHERALADTLDAVLPHVAVSASCDVLPMMREYERTSTACVNAYLRPLMEGYLQDFLENLASLEVDAPLRLMQSNGGLASAQLTQEKPVFAIESGPAAGVVAAVELAGRHGHLNVIAFDMGGTTAKATLIEGGRAHEAAEYEVGGPMTASRMLRGGGYAVGTPAIDIAEVGAGGGSIFWIDSGGAPHIGPQSAGAVPGPACYCRGGEEATVTDANVVLGYLNPEQIGGGSQIVDAERAAWVIDKKVATPLGVSRIEAAWGAHVLANASMGRAVRSVSMQRARDPRDFTLMAFGGSGPIHAVGLAQLFQIANVIVPPSPGLLSAIGLICADVTHDEVVSYRLGTNIDIEWLGANFERMAMAASDTLGPVRDSERAEVQRSLDLRYAGQSFELTIRVPDGSFEPAVEAAFHAFDAEYLRTYGHNLLTEPIEIVALRLRERRVDARRSEALHSALQNVSCASGSESATRRAYFGTAGGVVETPVMSRAQIDVDGLEGPLLIEEMDSTIVVPPGSRACSGEEGSILIQVGEHG